ncbi:hypothetical protein [Zobellia alginiliquefaciens]|uniref:hypothetical protein n=1 Tax=Zobellia alginiliquefaciens TaxID=3032586 RepID=UPI0023E4252A|nr:hypothetical protein [Zobellia alginiliquefaciens]
MSYNTRFRLDFNPVFFEITLLRKAVQFKTEIFVVHGLTISIFTKAGMGKYDQKYL